VISRLANGVRRHLEIGIVPRTDLIEINIPDEFWEPIGWTGVEEEDAPELFDRLLCGAMLNGAGLHLHAGRAHIDEDDCVVFSNPDMQRDLMPHLQQVYDGAYRLTRIYDADYIIYAVPHAD
jgi:hypothetical protein